MSDTPLDGYRRQYPDLPIRILEFFEVGNADRSGGTLRPRTVQEFLFSFGESNVGASLQPQFVVELCRRLGAFEWLSEMSTGGFSGLGNTYICTLKNGYEDPSVNRLLTCAAFGFPAVYDLYGPSVLPIVNENPEGILQIGTGFVVSETSIVTALHCVTDCVGVSVKGVSPDQLSQARFFSHPDATLDLACIVFSSAVFASLPYIPILDNDAEVLTEVMPMGYPAVPGFHPALAAEAATISARMTALRGRVASAPTELWSNAEMFLITARVRGGFSGGPVLDRLGKAVGVVSREPQAQSSTGGGHRYDNAGYGTAVPASSIRQMIRAISAETVQALDTSGVTFKEFE